MKISIIGVLIVFLCSCSKLEIKSYPVPKSENKMTFAHTLEPKNISNKGNQFDEKFMLTDFQASIPEGWKALKGEGMRKVSYIIDNTSIDFYAITMGTGDIESNVNRWRNQIGLEQEDKEVILSKAKMLNASGIPVQYFELYNEDTNQGILAAIINQSAVYWYFTAKGSVGELRDSSADIQRFINSIQFN